MIKRASQLMKGDWTNKQGFSLLEIIVSLVILSTLAAGIFATVSFAKRVSIQARQKSIAVSLVDSKLNELKSMDSENFKESESVADPLDPSVDADLTKCPDSKVPGTPGTPAVPPYCDTGSEFNGRMLFLVMASITANPPDSNFYEVLVVAKWLDFTVSGNRVRTETAVATMLK